MARDAARQVGSPIAVPLVKLAILATMCSRWAKRRQERKDFGGKEKFYALKDRALKVFAKQPWTRVRYVPGHRPRIDVDLCEDHRDDFREARRALDYDFWGWVEDNRRWIRKCPHCFYSEDRDHYALYDIELAIGDARFSWHVPYSLGREWLPPREGLEVVQRYDDPDDEPYEGAFLFGRPVTEREEILWPADRLVREIEAVLNLFEKQPSPGTGAESLETLN
jgi:hypothetical protein